MKIDVKNVARIADAKIDIDGITVLAGPNGSGKSTISRSLMAASSLSLHYAKLVELSRIDSILELIEHLFSSLHLAFGVVGDLHYVDENAWKPLLTTDFWLEPVTFLTWCKEHFVRNPARFPLVYMSDLSAQNVKAIKEQWGKVSESIRSRLSAKESDHARNAAEDVFSRAFAHQVKPLGRRSALGHIKVSDGNGSLNVAIKDGEVTGCSTRGAISISSLLYIEPANQLDFFIGSPLISRHMVRDEIDRYTALEFSYNNAINLDKPAPMTMEEKNQWRLSCECLDRILKKIGGKLNKTSNRLFFLENKDEGNLSIALPNMASGIKSIASICRAIEMNVLRKDGLLIIDEPESNLHPDWQVAVAEFLVVLCHRRGIKSLVNTHSPYMLRAFRHFEKKYGVKGTCSFYQMVNGKDGYYANPVTDQVDILFQDLFAPFEEIMRK